MKVSMELCRIMENSATFYGQHRTRGSNMRILDSIIHLEQLEYQYLQSFLGHGPLTTARYVFMGREEGLGDADGDNEESVRKRLMWYEDLHDCLGHLKRETNTWSDGFFIEKPEKTIREAVTSLTMYYQAYFKLVLDSNFTKFREDISTDMMKNCMVETLHISDGNTAMTELYPLPKQGKLMYRVGGERWNRYSQARESWESSTNHRRQLLTHLYNNYPVPVTICYAGREQGTFVAEKFFNKDLGFEFTRYNTGLVPENFKDRVKPSPRPKDILISKRDNKLGYRQRVILTPFWGVGHTSYDDINVILAWAAS